MIKPIYVYYAIVVLVAIFAFYLIVVVTSPTEYFGTRSYNTGNEWNKYNWNPQGVQHNMVMPSAYRVF